MLLLKKEVKMKAMSIIGIVVACLSMIIGFAGLATESISDAYTTTVFAMWGIIYLLGFTIYGLVMSSNFKVKNIKVLSIIGIVLCAWILSTELIENTEFNNEFVLLADWHVASVAWGVFNIYGLAYSITALAQSKKFSND